MKTRQKPQWHKKQFSFVDLDSIISTSDMALLAKILDSLMENKEKRLMRALEALQEQRKELYADFPYTFSASQAVCKD